MRNRVHFLLSFLLLGSSSFGQSFTGHVLDSLSGVAIPYATIYLVDHQTGTVADAKGTFTLPATLTGRTQVQISSIGYRTELFAIDPSSVRERSFRLTESHVELSEVVVSTSSNRLQRENIVPVVRMSLSELYQNAPTNLAEGLTSIPGVDNTSTGTGIGKPVIRGLSGNRIVVYAQNVRIENQQWGDEHGLGVGEVGIENVEVIKGASSLLYGADALGGVLYFVDERYAPIHTTTAFASTRFLSNSLGTYNDAGVKFSRDKFRMNVFGSYNANADYQLPSGERAFNSRFDGANLKAAIGYHHRQWIGNVRYSYLQNTFGIIEGDSLTSSTDRIAQLPKQFIGNHLVSTDHTFFVDRTKLTATLGYNTNDRQEFEEVPDSPALRLLLNTFTYNLKSSTSFRDDRMNLLLGVQGMMQENTNDAEEILIPDATTQDVGGYAVLHLSPTARWDVEGGVRFDARTIATDRTVSDEAEFPALDRSFSNVNFALGASHTLNAVQVRANITSGFRAPNTSELLSNGAHEGTLRYEIGNADLSSEQATQLDLSLTYTQEHFDLFVEPYFNGITDYIFLAPTDSVIEDRPVYVYRQTDARLFGGEAGFHWHPHPLDLLHIESAFSAVYGEDVAGNALPLMPANKLRTAVRAEFGGDGSFRLESAFIEHILRFEQDRTAAFETSTPSYTLINVGLTAKFGSEKNRFTLTGGVRNLLNTAYIDHLSRLKTFGVDNPGINFHVGLRWDLQPTRSVKPSGN